MSARLDRVRHWFFGAGALWRSGWSWWLGELSDSIPDALRAWVLGPWTEWVVEVDEDAVRLSRFRNGRPVGDVQQAHWQRREELASDINRLLGNADLSGASVRVLLRRPAVLSRPLDMPIAARRDINGAVFYQLPKLVPMSVDSVYFNCVATGETARSGYLRTELMVVHKWLVDAVVNQLLQRGARVVKVDGAAGQAHPLKKVHGKLSRSSKMTWWLACAACVLIAAIVVRYGLLLHRDISETETALAAIRAEAVAASELRRQVAEKAARISALAAMINQPSNFYLVERLTQRVPVDAYVLELRRTQDKVEINGLANNASDLILALREEPAFFNLALRSATRIDRHELERYEISFEVGFTAGSDR